MNQSESPTIIHNLSSETIVSQLKRRLRFVISTFGTFPWGWPDFVANMKSAHSRTSVIDTSGSSWEASQVHRVLIKAGNAICFPRNAPVFDLINSFFLPLLLSPGRIYGTPSHFSLIAPGQQKRGKFPRRSQLPSAFYGILPAPCTSIWRTLEKWH